jgi:4-hydroxybutyrate dehydrogenase
MMTQPNIRYLTNIYFEAGALSVLPEVLQKHHITKPLVITDKGLVKVGMLKHLRLSDAVIYDGVETNPTAFMAHAAAALYIENKCDGIIAMGGGSPIDLAKCAGILLAHELPLEEYAFITGGSSRINKIPPLIAIPTTAGSGSEVGRAALITLDDGRKVAIISDHLLPAATICDPGLTMEMPSQLAAATGMDAISHCVETYCSIRINTVADAIALDGLERGIKNIIPSANECNSQSRGEMMMCSLQGGLAFQKGLGAVHSLSHPLGGLTEKKLHHGMLNAIFLPHVITFNEEYCGNKMQVIAKIMNVGDASSVALAFTDLIAALGLPTRLRDLGISREELEPLAPLAMRDHCTATNPRPMVTEDFVHLYNEAF